MNQYVTGAVIKRLREEKNMTQQQLADKLSVSAKTISKWETAKGYPDITLLESIANALSVSVTELISGNTIVNSNVSANMLRSHFYVCPVCGNIVHSMGETVIQCHGLQLQQEEAEETDEHHKIFVEQDENIESRVWTFFQFGKCFLFSCLGRGNFRCRSFFLLFFREQVDVVLRVFRFILFLVFIGFFPVYVIYSGVVLYLTP